MTSDAAWPREAFVWIWLPGRISLADTRHRAPKPSYPGLLRAFPTAGHDRGQPASERSLLTPALSSPRGGEGTLATAAPA